MSFSPITQNVCKHGSTGASRARFRFKQKIRAPMSQKISAKKRPKILTKLFRAYKSLYRQCGLSLENAAGARLAELWIRAGMAGAASDRFDAR